MRSDRDRLLDIAEEIEAIERYAERGKHRFATKAEVRRAVARYNRVRRHSSCEMKSPVAYEAILADRAAQQALDEEAA